jgi:hypothetical protein
MRNVRDKVPVGPHSSLVMSFQIRAATNDQTLERSKALHGLGQTFNCRAILDQKPLKSRELSNPLWQLCQGTEFDQVEHFKGVFSSF